MKGSLIVEFEYEDEDVSLKRFERDVSHWLTEKVTAITVTHVEAASGNLTAAFGIWKSEARP